MSIEQISHVSLSEMITFFRLDLQFTITIYVVV